MSSTRIVSQTWPLTGSFPHIAHRGAHRANMTTGQKFRRRLAELRWLAGHVAAWRPLTGWDPSPGVYVPRAVLAGIAFLAIATTTIWGIA